MYVLIFVGKLVDASVDRNCWKSRGITYGCSKYSRIQVTTISSLALDATRTSGKVHLGRLRWWGEEDIVVGDSDWPDWPDNDRPGDIPLPDWLRNSSQFSGSTKNVSVVENGTVCFCNTDLCNSNGNGNDNGNGNENGDTGGSSLQTSGSSYFVVICVLILAALVTLSTTIDDQLWKKLLNNDDCDCLNCRITSKEHKNAYKFDFVKITSVLTFHHWPS